MWPVHKLRTGPIRNLWTGLNCCAGHLPLYWLSKFGL
jgi:hypothetical protein